MEWLPSCIPQHSSVCSDQRLDVSSIDVTSKARFKRAFFKTFKIVMSDEY